MNLTSQGKTTCNIYLRNVHEVLSLTIKGNFILLLKIDLLARIKMFEKLEQQGSGEAQLVECPPTVPKVQVSNLGTY
jgi:hypothetical protein